ncbi:soluble lytic murein transglycosylase-like protein [Sphingomonas leidyi]|uniref:Soluble lytic murein transglycosylase-like protein n=1 Tax=Sphingomonas leidyi TaxID=68569 RepID=A0A7X5UXZ2_9SPHN|nr:soluble lytic murein transglycosylase-like protein [Sphingomonas leidyi]
MLGARHRQSVRVLSVMTAAAIAFGLPPIGGMARAQLAVAPPSAAPSIATFVTEAARRFGLPEHWIYAVMRVESAGDRRAVSSAGAMGLMQIMPATWASLRARYGLGDDAFDPRDNIMAGTAYLREMHDRYGSPGFLAAYNAGPGRYDEHLKRGRPLRSETVAYLAKLAPIVGGDATSQHVAAAAPDPLAWTRSALFAVRSTVIATVTVEPSDAEPTTVKSDAPAAPETTVIPAVGAPAEGLFVARSGQLPR